MTNKKQDAVIGFALLGAMFFALLAAKLAGIDLSWWSVTSPLWIPALMFVIATVFFLVAEIVSK